MSIDRAQADLIDALAGGGCAVCALVVRAVQGHLRAYAVEGVNDLDIRARLRASRGYCPRHAEQFWQEERHPLGVAMIYEDVVTNLLRALREVDPAAATPLRQLIAALGGTGSPATADAAALRPRAACPACAAEADAERRAVAALLRHLSEPPVAAAYRAGGGLCLPHFTRTLDAAGRADHLALLIETQTAAWEALHGALGEYIRLNDYRFRDEPRGDEQRSPRRALRMIAGDPRLNGGRGAGDGGAPRA